MKLFAGITAFILLFAGVLQAQVLSPDMGISSNTYTFHNHTYPDTLLRNTSYIIQELSVGNKVSQAESNYNMKYEVFTRKEKASGIVFLGILLHKIHEPVTYKDFDIRNLLIPSGIRFNVHHLKKGRIILSYKRLVSDLEEFDTTWIQLNDSLLKHTTGIKLENVDFYYDEAKLQRVVHRMQMINDYYASKLIIDSLRALAQKMDPGSPEHLASNLIFLFDLRKINEGIKSKDFESSLGINYHDPAHLKEALRMLELLENRVQTLSEQGMSSKKGLTQKEIEEAFDYYIELQKNYIKWANAAEHSYQESFYNLLVKSYTAKDIAFYENYLTKLNSAGLLPYAYECFYRKNLEFVDECINNQLYLNALGVLASLDNLSVIAPEYADVLILKRYSSRAKHGLFESYMRVARRAIQVKNFDLAREYLSRAENYQRENSSFIISDIDIRNGRRQLSEAYVETAAGNIAAGEFENALHLLRLAGNARDAYNVIIVDEEKYDSLLIKARRGIFQNFLATASAYFNAGDFADARIYLNKAEEYNRNNNYIPGGTSAIINLPAYESYLSEAKNRMQEGSFEEALLILEKIKKDKSPLLDKKEIDTLIKRSAKLLAERWITDIDNLLFNQKADEAKSLLAKTDSIVAIYEIVEPSFLNDLEIMHDMVQNLICNNYLNKYKELTGAGDEMVEQRKFIAAESYYQQAANLNKELLDCGISDTTASFQLNLYSEAADYERRLHDIQKSLFKEGFVNIINDYLLLEEEYYNKNLRGLNVKHTTFVDFLYDQQNPDLVIKSFRYFLENENCKESLKMLDLLKQLDYNRNKTRQMQRDAAELCFRKQVQVSSEYTDDTDKWYHYFRKRLNGLQKHQKVKQIFKSGKN